MSGFWVRVGQETHPPTTIGFFHRTNVNKETVTAWSGWNQCSQIVVQTIVDSISIRYSMGTGGSIDTSTNLKRMFIMNINIT